MADNNRAHNICDDSKGANLENSCVEEEDRDFCRRHAEGKVEYLVGVETLLRYCLYGASYSIRRGLTWFKTINFSGDFATYSM